jgi:hypothetical protein
MSKLKHCPCALPKLCKSIQVQKKTIKYSKKKEKSNEPRRVDPRPVGRKRVRLHRQIDGAGNVALLDWESID